MPGDGHRSELGQRRVKSREFVGQKQQNLVSADENGNRCWSDGLGRVVQTNPVFCSIMDRLQASLETLEGAPG